MHVEGKINNKYPIFNDLLTFMWCKMKLCAKDVLINILKQYYQSAEIMKARDVAYEEFPVTEDSERRVKHRKSEDALNAIYVILQNLPVEDPPVFAAINLNNIPYVELKNVDGAALMWQQGQLKDQLQSMVEEHTVIKAQLASIIDHLQNGKSCTSSTKPAETDEHPRTRAGRHPAGGPAYPRAPACPRAPAYSYTSALPAAHLGPGRTSIHRGSTCRCHRGSAPSPHI